MTWELSFTPDAVREIAAQAMKKGTGARALRGILERLMLEQMFEIPGSPDIEAVTITAAVVRGDSQPIVRRRASREGRRLTWSARRSIRPPSRGPQ